MTLIKDLDWFDRGLSVLTSLGTIIAGVAAAYTARIMLRENRANQARFEAQRTEEERRRKEDELIRLISEVLNDGLSFPEICDALVGVVLRGHDFERVSQEFKNQRTMRGHVAAFENARILGFVSERVSDMAKYLAQREAALSKEALAECETDRP